MENAAPLVLVLVGVGPRGPDDPTTDPGRLLADPHVDGGAGLGPGRGDRRPDREAQDGRQAVPSESGGAPENTGSQRLLEIAGRGDRHDRILYSGTAKATGGAGNSNALVGTPDQVAEALLADVDLGVDIISARGHDTLADAIDFGDQVIPLVRAEVARREAAAA